MDELEKLRARRKIKTTDGLSNLYPKQPCHKCGKRLWTVEVTPLTWGCGICGNLIYYSYGTLKQQIDIVMQSDRKDEFVKSADGKSTLPKKNEEIRKIKFEQQMQKNEKS